MRLTIHVKLKFEVDFVDQLVKLLKLTGKTNQDCERAPSELHPKLTLKRGNHSRFRLFKNDELESFDHIVYLRVLAWVDDGSADLVLIV